MLDSRNLAHVFSCISVCMSTLVDFQGSVYLEIVLEQFFVGIFVSVVVSHDWLVGGGVSRLL